MRAEVTVPSKAFFVRQAEVTDGGTNGTVSVRANASSGKALTFGATGGEATYNINIGGQAKPSVYMMIRYSDDDGGNNGNYPGNLIQVYVDGQLKDQTHTMNTAGWDDFETLPSLYLGDLSAGSHTIRIVVGALTFGADIDEFQLVSQAVAASTKHTVLTRQGESYNSGTNQTIETRSGAVSNQSVHIDMSGGHVAYNFTAPTTTSNTYVQLRYVDELGPTKLDIYLDGFLMARFPTRDGTSWTDWMYSSELYLGTLTSGSHQILIEFAPETYGADIDQFEIYWY
jgi:hypothetical protein